MVIRLIAIARFERANIRLIFKLIKRREKFIRLFPETRHGVRPRLPALPAKAKIPPVRGGISVVTRQNFRSNRKIFPHGRCRGTARPCPPLLGGLAAVAFAARCKLMAAPQATTGYPSCALPPRLSLFERERTCHSPRHSLSLHKAGGGSAVPNQKTSFSFATALTFHYLCRR